MAERILFSHLQRTSMLAADRQANAMEQIAIAVTAIAKQMGAKLPEPVVAAVEEPPKAEPFNPYTESAPGVPLKGQEPEEPKSLDKAFSPAESTKDKEKDSVKDKKAS